MKRIASQTLFFIYLLAIVALALIPTGPLAISMDKLSVFSLRLDYLLHIAVFIPLLPVHQWLWPRHDHRLALIAALMLALAAEGFHYFLAYRSFNPNDMVANMAGVLTGYLLARLWKFSLRFIKKN